MDLSGRLIQGTGAYEIKQASADDGVIKKGDFWLECTADGTVGFLSDQAYGEWEFDLYKEYDDNVIEVMFLSDKIGGRTEIYGYIFNVGNGEQYRIYAGNPGSSLPVLLQGSDDYMSLNTWYRIKITRTLDGEFYFYIKGGEFGVENWTLVPAGVYGNNPATNTTYDSSTYIVINSDLGDRFTNLITRKAVKQ